jgi:hypothetical protein
VNLDQLRKQAKELVKAARADDPEALPRLGGREPILASAQLVLAQERGYSSWPALVTAAEANAKAFILAATSGRCRRAEAMLAARPEIDADPWARLVLGREWEGRPDRSKADFDTPLGWAAYSPQHHERPGRDYVAAAELLVEAGNAVEPRFLDIAEGPLYEWLEERLSELQD